MKSGLYACAGASATASAAAWAKRFDEPMTNESKVYFGLRPSDATRAGRAGARSSRRRRRRSRDDDAHRPLVAERVADDRLEQAEEVPLDPLPGEVVRDEQDERLVVERTGLRVGEPRVVGRVVERVPQTGRDLGPKASALSSDVRSTPLTRSSAGLREAAIIAAASWARFNALAWGNRRRQKGRVCRDLYLLHNFSTAVESRFDAAAHAPSRLWISDLCAKSLARRRCDALALYWPPGRSSGRFRHSRSP